MQEMVVAGMETQDTMYIGFHFDENIPIHWPWAFGHFGVWAFGWPLGRIVNK